MDCWRIPRTGSGVHMPLQAAVVRDTVPAVEAHHTGFVAVVDYTDFVAVADYTDFVVAEVVVFGLLVKGFHRRHRTLFHLLLDFDSGDKSFMISFVSWLFPGCSLYRQE